MTYLTTVNIQVKMILMISLAEADYQCLHYLKIIRKSKHSNQNDAEDSLVETAYRRFLYYKTISHAQCEGNTRLNKTVNQAPTKGKNHKQLNPKLLSKDKQIKQNARSGRFFAQEQDKDKFYITTRFIVMTTNLKRNLILDS